VTGEKLTKRTKTVRAAKYSYQEPVPNRRDGFDYLVTLPKSVSLYIEYNPDRAKNIEGIVMDTWRESMGEVEKLSCARDRKDGADYDRVTAELTYIGVIHRDARQATKGAEPDCHFHVHTWIGNATYDSVENEWKALQPVEMVRQLDTISV
jgi:hypothetical protein